MFGTEKNLSTTEMGMKLELKSLVKSAIKNIKDNEYYALHGIAYIPTCDINLINECFIEEDLGQILNMEDVGKSFVNYLTSEGGYYLKINWTTCISSITRVKTNLYDFDDVDKFEECTNVLVDLVHRNSHTIGQNIFIIAENGGEVSIPFLSVTDILFSFKNFELDFCGKSRYVKTSEGYYQSVFNVVLKEFSNGGTIHCVYDFRTYKLFMSL